MSGGRGRTSLRGNGRGQHVSQRNIEYNRQDRTWLPSASMEGRSDIRLEMPPEPESSRFSDWSSVGSLPTRTSPQSTPDRRAEQSENIQNQLNTPAAVETRTERVGTHPSEEVDISPQTDQPREDQNIPTVVEPAPLNISVGTQRNSVESNEENVNNVPTPQVSRGVRPTLHVNDLPLSRDVPWESNNIYNHSRDSQIRTQDIDIRGISSIHPVERENNDRHIVPDCGSSIPYYPHEGINPPRTSTANRRDNSSDDNRLLRRRGYSQVGGRPPEREGYPSSDRRPLRRRGLPSNGRPPDRY